METVAADRCVSALLCHSLTHSLTRLRAQARLTAFDRACRPPRCCVRRMVASTERYLVALPSAEQLGGHVARMGGSNENLAGLAGGGGADSPESNELFELLGHSELCTRLDKYFAVLNGLVYSKPAVRKFISSSHGASRLVSSRLVSSRLISSVCTCHHTHARHRTCEALCAPGDRFCPGDCLPSSSSSLLRMDCVLCPVLVSKTNRDWLGAETFTT